MISIKKIIFVALWALTGLFVISCSVNDMSINDVENGSVSIKFAIPNFMKTETTDASSRMIMPSTRVIKFYIYTDDTLETTLYTKQFSVDNSGLSYNDYTMITARLDDVPVGTYAEGTMLVELYDSKVDFILTQALNDSEVEVTASGDPASVTFYALPETFMDITDEFIDEDEDGVYEVNSFQTEILLDEETLSGYDIYFEVYQVTVPSGYGLDVILNGTNESENEVAVVVYDEFGVATDADITVKNDASFENEVFAQIPTSYDDTYYVVLYTKGVLGGLDDAEYANVTFNLSEEE